MIAGLVNHLWQSTLVACVVGLLMLILRKNRAAVRHGLWLAASVKFLVPFSLLIGLGSQLEVAEGLHGRFSSHDWTRCCQIRDPIAIAASPAGSYCTAKAPRAAPRQLCSGVWLCVIRRQLSGVVAALAARCVRHGAPRRPCT